MRSTLDEKVLAKHWDGLLPVNLDKILSDMGIQVRNTDTNDFCCQITMENEQRFVLINPNESVVRQRYSKSLGLAVILLGYTNTPPQVLKVGRGAFVGEYSGITGRTLTNLAKKIIMPKFALEHSILKENIHSITALAAKFSVSEHIMKSRLQDLNFLPNG